MKKIALAAFSATALLALSACGDAADDEATDTTVVEEEVAPVEPVAEDTTVVDDTAADDTAEAVDDAADAAEETAEEAADAAE